MNDSALVFNPPPGWPEPPANWIPPKGWEPDPTWPAPPDGWQLWIPRSNQDQEKEVKAQLSCAEESSEVQATNVDEASRVYFLTAENAALKAQLKAFQTLDDSNTFNDEWILQESGIYRYHHPLENAAAYQGRLQELSAQIAEIVKSGRAIEKSETFTFDNSLAKGRKMTNDLAKLMLRAYNAEADNSIRALRAGNVLAAKKRMERSREAIAKYGNLMQMHIS
ncbi:MAG: DUF4041 domain-containing protein, partial [Firmicutes bacterium]|nr:DUF4041 domain-containing protein [Bacillota bacterium]